MKIALICAYPAGSNHGMISVDFAFETIKKYFSKDIEITRFCAWKSINHRDGDMVYQELHSIDQIKNYDKIIYWGDFLHWLTYGNDWVEKTTSRNPLLTKEDALDLWYQIYFLENLPELQKKVIVFGGTIYGLTAEQLTSSRYNNALTQLYKNSSMALMRDIVSANFVNQIAPLKETTFGCDCALLLDSNELIKIEGAKKDFIIAYSYGRSGHTEKFKNLTQLIAEKLGATVVDLEWLQKGASLTRLSEKLLLIKQASLVITDIYHCAVNANREGVPTICITNGASIIAGTLSDKKKEIFYLQHFMSDRLYYSEKIELLTSEVVEKIVKETDTSDLITSTLYSQIQKSLKLLVNEVNKV